MHQSSTSIYIPNFIEIKETFYGWTDGRTLETDCIRSTRRSGPKNKSWLSFQWLSCFYGLYTFSANNRPNVMFSCSLSSQKYMPIHAVDLTQDLHAAFRHKVFNVNRLIVRREERRTYICVLHWRRHPVCWYSCNVSRNAIRHFFMLTMWHDTTDSSTLPRHQRQPNIDKYNFSQADHDDAHTGTVPKKLAATSWV